MDPKTKTLLDFGYDPNQFDIDSDFNIVEKAPASYRAAPDKHSALGTFAQHAAGGVVPTATALAGGAAAMKTLGKVVPHPLAKFLLSAGGALLGGVGGSKVQEAVLPEAANRSLAESYTEHPIAATAGNLAAALPMLRPDLKAVTQSGTIAKRLLSGQQKSLSPNEMNALANVGGGAGIGAGLSIADDLMSGQEVSLAKALLSGAGEAVINNPRKFMKRFGFEENVYDPDPVAAYNEALHRSNTPIDSEVSGPEPTPVPTPKVSAEFKPKQTGVVGHFKPGESRTYGRRPEPTQADIEGRYQQGDKGDDKFLKPSDAFKDVSKKFFKLWRNVDVKEQDLKGPRGEYKTAEREILLDPVEAHMQTHFHEGSHMFIDDLIKQDNSFAKKFIKTVEQSPEFRDYVIKHPEQRGKMVTKHLDQAMDEFIAEKGGWAAAKIVVENKPTTWKEVVDHLSKKWTGKLDADDYAKMFASRLFRDAPYGGDIQLTIGEAAERYQDYEPTDNEKRYVDEVIATTEETNSRRVRNPQDGYVLYTQGVREILADAINEGPRSAYRIAETISNAANAKLNPQIKALTSSYRAKELNPILSGDSKSMIDSAFRSLNGFYNIYPRGFFDADFREKFLPEQYRKLQAREIFRLLYLSESLDKQFKQSGIAWFEVAPIGGGIPAKIERAFLDFLTAIGYGSKKQQHDLVVERGSVANAINKLKQLLDPTDAILGSGLPEHFNVYRMIDKHLNTFLAPLKFYGPNRREINTSVVEAAREIPLYRENSNDWNNVTSVKQLKQIAKDAYIESLYAETEPLSYSNIFTKTDNIIFPDNSAYLRALANKYQNCLACYVDAVKKGDTYVIETSNAVAEINKGKQLIQHFGVRNTLPSAQDIQDMLAFAKANDIKLAPNTWESTKQIYQDQIETIESRRFQEVEEDPILALNIRKYLGSDVYNNYKKIVASQDANAVLNFQENLRPRLEQAAARSNAAFAEMYEEHGPRTEVVDLAKKEAQRGGRRDTVENQARRLQEVETSAWDTQDVVYKIPVDIEFNLAQLVEALTNNKRYGKLARRISESASPGLLNKPVISVKGFGVHQGSYEMANEVHRGRVELGEEFSGYVAMHEAIHAATSEKLQQALPELSKVSGAAYKRWLDMYEAVGEDEVIRDLITLYKKVVKDLGMTQHLFGSDGLAGKPKAMAYRDPEQGFDYGLSDIHEFLAEAMTDHRFQRRLNAVDAPEGFGSWVKNGWDALLDVIRRMFSFEKKDMTALEAAVKVVDNLSRKADPPLYTRRLQDIDDDQFFITEFQRELNTGKPFGLQKNKEGKFKADTLLARMRSRLSEKEFKSIPEETISRLKDAAKAGQALALHDIQRTTKGGYGITKYDDDPNLSGPEVTYRQNLADLQHEFDTDVASQAGGFIKIIKTTGEWTLRIPRVNSKGYTEPWIIARISEDPWTNKIEDFRTTFNMDKLKAPSGVPKNLIERGVAIFKQMHANVKAASDLGARVLYPANTVNRTNWSTIAPKAKKDMPGYVEVSVQKDGSTDSSATGHNFPEGTLAHFRGYSEGDIFHVIEVQSDMERVGREELDKAAPHLEAEYKSLEEANKYYQEALKANDKREAEHYKLVIEDINKSINAIKQDIIRWDKNPELENYHAIAIKAAIRHAIQTGHSKIALPDVKTSMMTQDHLRGIVTTQKVFPDKASAEQEVKALRDMDYPIDSYYEYDAYNNRHLVMVEPVYAIKAKKLKVEYKTKSGETKTKSRGYYLNREPGHRTNYEEKLPAILNKLLKTKSKKVDFGQARGDRWPNNFVRKYFDEPNFRNVTANVWDIKPEIAEKFKSTPTLVGQKRYQSADEPVDYTKMIPRLDSWLTGRVEAVRQTAGGGESQSYLADRGIEYYRKKRFYEGKWANRAVLFFDGYNPQKGTEENIIRYLWERRHNKETDIQLTEKEEQIVSLWKKHLKEVAQHHKDIGMKIRSPKDEDGKVQLRNIFEDPDYSPDMPSLDVIHHLVNHSAATDSRASRLKQEFVEHAMMEGNMKEKEAEEFYSQYIDAVSGARNIKGEGDATLFNALRKAQGIGLPYSWIEKNPIAMANRYGRRVAHDFAFFESLQSDPIARWVSGIVGQDGAKPEKMVGYESIADNPDVRDMLHGILAGDAPLMQANKQFHARIMAAARAVANSIMGVGTGMRDIFAMPAQASPYLSVGDLPAILKGAGNVFNVRKKALESGATQLNYDNLHYGDLTYANPDAFVRNVSRLSQLLRKWGGRQTLENFSRHLTFSIGEEVARTKIAQAKAGDKVAQSWLEKFTKSVDDINAEDTIQRIAKEFTDRVQGAYDAENLPGIAIDSQFSPFFNLARWSIEKYNVIKQDVFGELKQGNYGPLLKYVFGTLLSGAAIEQLNELLSNKRQHDPTIEESFLSPDADVDDYVYKIISLAQLGAFAGIGADGAKLITSLGAGNVNYANPISFPLYSFATQSVGQNVADAVGAIQDGEDPVEVLGLLVHAIASESNQNYRYMQSHINDDETKRKERYRDLAVWKRINDERDSITDIRANKFLNTEEKEFKRTSDVNEAVELLPSLIDTAIEKSKGDPYKLKRELQSIKQNSYQTMPSPKNMPLSFMSYILHLEKTQGKEAANKRLADYVRQNELNKAKSSLVP